MKVFTFLFSLLTSISYNEFMIKVINFEDKYLQDIRDINRACSTHPNRPENEKAFYRYVYIDYYAFMSKENCFVAIDDTSGEILGYVVSENDLKRYEDHMLNTYIHEAVKLKEDFADFLKNEVKPYEKWNKQYNSHMHMDVKPGHQHQGIGTMLIQHEIKHQKQVGSKGMMLLCSIDNENANKFYQKNGIELLEQTTCNVRGIKL